MAAIFLQARAKRIISGGGISIAALVLGSLPFTIDLWKGTWDYYSAYSGVIAEKGTEFRVFPTPRTSRYLVLKNPDGSIFKKYVSYYGHAFAKEGTFVVKKRGFGNYPMRPGEKTSSELLSEAERIKAERNREVPNTN